MEPQLALLLDPVTPEILEDLARQVPGLVARSLATSPSAINRASYIVSHDQDVDASVLGRAPDLRAVVKVDSYFGAVDLAECSRRKILVVGVRNVSLLSVAEHAVMAMLILEKRVEEAVRRFHAGIVAGDVQPALTTQTSYAYNWVGLEGWDALYGKRVGLVGLGMIGSAVAERLRGFGVSVVYTKRQRVAPEVERDLGVEYVSLDELLGTSDHVSLHLPFEPANEAMIGEREFGVMKPGAFFINTARGRLVDEWALVAALESGHLGGAALDVFQFEPLQVDSPLRTAPNVLLTPHSAGIPVAGYDPRELASIAAELRRLVNA